MKNKKLSNEWIAQEEKKYIASGQKIPYVPIAFESGKGAILYDYNGNEYIDFLSSASSANIGHGNIEVADVVREQMAKIAQFTLVYFNSNEPVELAKKLCEITPGNKPKKVVYSSTGSASIDGAIKIARAYTGRRKVVSFIESYHGSTFGAISLSAISLGMRNKIGPLLSEVEHFSYPNCLRCKYHCSVDTCSMACFEEIEYALEHYIPVNEIAAVFIEPIAGDAGLIVPPKKYMKKLRELCTENGILLVSDEIQQGLGRTGKWFGIENFDIEADLYVLGKSIGGGLPLGAVIGDAEVIDALDSPGHVFSMTGNQTVCAAGMKTLEIIERENLLDQSASLGEYTKSRFEEMKDKYSFVGDVRGYGLSIGVDLVKDKVSMEKNYEAAVKISHRCVENGLIIIFIGQSTLRIQPPLVISKEEIDRALEIIEEAFLAYENGEISENALSVISGW